MAIDSIDTPSPMAEAVPARGPSFRLLAIAALLLLLIGVIGGGWAVNRWLAGDATAPAAKAIDTQTVGDLADPALLAGAAPKGSAADQPLIVAPVDGANALAARVAELEQRLSRITLQAESASGNASRSEGLLVAFAVRRALDRGLSLGYLDAQLRRQRVEFGAQLLERHRLARGINDRFDRIGLIVAKAQAQLRIKITERQPAIERAAPGERYEQAFGA